MRRSSKTSMLAGSLVILAASNSAFAAPLLGTPAKCFGVDLSTSGLFGTNPKALNYEVPNDGIENYMPIATAKQGLPETIQGIWWMDGNPGGLLVTLGNATYDAATRTARMPTSDFATYAFAPSADAGCPEENEAKQGGFLIKFSEDSKHAFLVPFTVDSAGKDQEDTQDTRFSMDLSEDGHWVRHSALFGITIPDYHLRRIVNADGTRDDFMYNEYLSFAGPTAVVGPHGPGGMK